jgi:formamidopyrimidine-DNA glycosylase
MPELPEVELVSRSLNTLVRGRTIRNALLLRERLAPASTPDEFARDISGAKINFVGRRGKHLLIDLDNSKTLIVHLRMSGRFSVLAAERENPRFTHAVFHFSDDERLVFDDQRHFGLMKIVDTGRSHEAKELAKLAPEPFSEEFTLGYLRNALAGSGRSLKEFLLDQTKVCGLGNIYAAEAMFAARIDPRIAANSVSPRRAARLFESIRAVLSEAVEHNAGRPVDPENLEGSYFSGGNPDGWFVYDRENQECVNCKSPIIRLKQGGRSTYYCRRCQRR